MISSVTYWCVQCIYEKLNELLLRIIYKIIAKNRCLRRIIINTCRYFHSKLYILLRECEKNIFYLIRQLVFDVISCYLYIRVYSQTTRTCDDQYHSVQLSFAFLGIWEYSPEFSIDLQGYFHYFPIARWYCSVWNVFWDVKNLTDQCIYKYMYSNKMCKQQSLYDFSSKHTLFQNNIW